MNAANSQQTKIFGMKLGVNPKIVVAGLLAVAGLLFWINSRGDDTPESARPSSHAETAAETTATYTPEPAPARTRTAGLRRRSAHEDRGALKLKTITPGTGEVDPVLRLDLLEKLAKVEPPAESRNLFEMGATPMAAQTGAMPVRTVIPKPLPVVQQAPPPMAMTPQLNISLKYYGFAKPSRQGGVNRGFFMDGDNVIVVAEGQLLQGRYLVEQLTPGGARLKDTQMQLSQTLPVAPEALEQNANAFNRPQMPGMMQQQQQPDNNGFPNQGEPSEQ